MGRSCGARRSGPRSRPTGCTRRIRSRPRRPASDGERLFATFGELGDVVALGLDGEELWRVAVGRYATTADFGTGSALRAARGKVFVQCDNEENSFILALDAESGEEVWRRQRRKGTSWATPMLWTYAGGNGRPVEELVCLGSGDVRAYEPESGSELWKLSGWKGSFASSPACDAAGLYFGNSGPGVPGRLMSVRPGVRGEHAMESSKDPEIAAWSSRRGAPAFASLLAFDGLVYSVGSTGVLFVVDAETGERVYQQRLPDARSIVASPWTDGEFVYILDEEGKTFVLRLGGEFELVHTNRVEGLFWGTPSVAGDALLLRDSDALICVRAAEEKGGR